LQPKKRGIESRPEHLPWANLRTTTTSDNNIHHGAYCVWYEMHYEVLTESFTGTSKHRSQEAEEEVVQGKGYAIKILILLRIEKK
jgi:hypothetical protein